MSINYGPLKERKPRHNFALFTYNGELFKEKSIKQNVLP